MDERQLICADLNELVSIENASAVIMNLTLQFIRPVRRAQVMKNIAAGVNKGGCLLVIEKVLSKDTQFNRSFIKYYYDLKRRNGYSDLEIAQKREALENVLIPYRLEENFELFLDSGFKECEVFFRWYNFCGICEINSALNMTSTAPASIASFHRSETSASPSPVCRLTGK